MNDSTSDNAGVITIPPIIYLVGLLLGFLIHYFYPLRFLSASVSVRLGVLLILAPIPIALLGMLALKRAETPVDVRKPTTAIVTNGIYRLSRNPMYVSLAFVYLGIACYLLLGSKNIFDAKVKRNIGNDYICSNIDFTFAKASWSYVFDLWCGL